MALVFVIGYKLFKHGAHMRIILNGWLTDKIPLAHDVRQGDSLSPLLYVFCVEVLAVFCS